MEYLFPETLKQAFTTLESEKSIRIIAGGTDLAVLFSEGVPMPDTLVDISRIGELSLVDVKDDVVLGGAVTIAEIAGCAELPLSLRQGAAAIGSPQIRNVATIGGNICNASPCGDTLSPLVALNAGFLLVKNGKERRVPAEEFFTGPKETILEPGELLATVTIPARYRNGKSSFRMIGKRNGQVISQVNCALWMVQKGNIIEEIRICFGSVAPVPLRCRDAETFLTGKEATEEYGAQAARLVREEISPIDDVRATQEYRLQVAEGLFRDLFREAAGLEI